MTTRHFLSESTFCVDPRTRRPDSATDGGDFIAVSNTSPIRAIESPNTIAMDEADQSQQRRRAYNETGPIADSSKPVAYALKRLDVMGGAVPSEPT
jgi:hypothetical protein